MSIVALLKSGFFPDVVTFKYPVLSVIALVVLVGCGIGGIVRAVEAKKAGVSKWGILLALAILTVVLGAVILSDPFSALETAIMVIGAGLIYEGATDLITAIVAGRRIEEWRKSEKP